MEANAKFKNTQQSYGVGTLYQKNGDPVTSRQQATQLAANKTGQSWSDKVDSEAAQKTAMQHPNKLGAGARKREHLSAPDKKAVVMKEFQKGTLHSGSGQIVTNPRQAVAISYSEAGEKNYKKKQSDRKKADRYGVSK